MLSGGRMAIIGGYLKVCFVALTAAMTLVTGTPHVHCQCPNGNIKPFCLSMFSSESGCCCDGACCAFAPGASCCCHGQTADAKHSKKSSCCAQSHGGRSHSGLNLAKPSCVKHLEQQTAVTTA